MRSRAQEPPAGPDEVQTSVQLLDSPFDSSWSLFISCDLLFPPTIKSFVGSVLVFVRGVKGTSETSLGRAWWRELGR